MQLFMKRRRKDEHGFGLLMLTAINGTKLLIINWIW